MSSEPESRGQLFVVSAPSGTGKTTLVERLVQLVPDLMLSRSYTSREPRAGEGDGVDYNFISREQFEAMKAAGGFLECADVFGNYYGTSATATEAVLVSGCDLVLVIDVQGARQVRARTTGSVGIFVLPPSFPVLEDRLRKRSKDSEAQIRRRLEVARSEVDAVADYDYVVVNDDVDAAVLRLKAVIEAERAKLRRMKPQAAKIIETFR
jgi:guanylate kinase